MSGYERLKRCRPKNPLHEKSTGSGNAAPVGCGQALVYQLRPTQECAALWHVDGALTCSWHSLLHPASTKLPETYCVQTASVPRLLHSSPNLARSKECYEEGDSLLPTALSLRI